MEIRFVTHHVSINENLKEYMETKLSKLERYFSRIIDVQVAAKKGDRNTVTVEVTANAAGVILRAEHRDSDMRAAFDQALRTVERRVRRHKEFLVDRAQMREVPDFDLGPREEKDAPQDWSVVREKVVDPHPMTVREATLKMDLLGHSFFLFIDSESGDTAVVYRREDGGYGLLRLAR